MNQSVSLGRGLEFVEIEPHNPFLSKCVVKVCYVCDTPNRNGTALSKEVLTKMAETLPGCPIVGFYNEDKKDFEEHNSVLAIEDDCLVFKSQTVPYGFVPTDAKIWFEEYLEPNGVVREYLVTEGYLWTGVYPESQRIIEHGNHQSMEIEDIEGHWTIDNKTQREYFIINDAIFSKLCVLGEDVEPCFEGASIAKSYTLKFDKDFEERMCSFVQQLQEYTKKGGTDQMNLQFKVMEVGSAIMNLVYSFLGTEFAVTDAESGDVTGSTHYVKGFCENTETLELYAILANKEDETVAYAAITGQDTEEVQVSLVDSLEYALADEATFTVADLEEYETNFFKKKDEEDEEGEKDAEPKGEGEDDEEDEEKKKKHSLTDNVDPVAEPVVTVAEPDPTMHEILAAYKAVKEENEILREDVKSLKAYRDSAEKVKKTELIDSFYSLSDEAKEDVISNIDTYSLETIEAKLYAAYGRQEMTKIAGEGAVSKDTVTSAVYSLDKPVSSDSWTEIVKARRAQ